ncbi:MAG TPA: AAA family ATPase, partial [Roseomonas sp.]
LDAVAARGGLDGALLDAVADAVVAMHAAAPVAVAAAPAAMAKVLDGNRDAALAAGLDADAVDGWAAAARAALAKAAPLLAARAGQGRLRRCHGDLHLGNLCLLDGRPAPFDALEFDEALATIDTGYDLAFLLMDLDRRAGRAAANRVLNRYAACSGDAGFLGALPLFLSLRALIRAHVEARKGGDGAAYLAAARRYLSPAPPRLVGIGGLQGTGKSRLARLLAPGLGAAPGALVLRTDEIRKRRAGVAFEQRLPPEAYAPAESRAVHDALFMAAAAALAAGHAVVADAVWLDPAMRAQLEAVAARGGAPFEGIWLQAPIAVLRARIAARRGDASDADAAVLDHAAQADSGPLTWHRLDASGDPLPAALSTLGQDG